MTPFEIEPDPEEEALREANARREAEAGARAARIRAKARRWACTAPPHCHARHGRDLAHRVAHADRPEVVWINQAG